MTWAVAQDGAKPRQSSKGRLSSSDDYVEGIQTRQHIVDMFWTLPCSLGQHTDVGTLNKDVATPAKHQHWPHYIPETSCTHLR